MYAAVIWIKKVLALLFQSKTDRYFSESVYRKHFSVHYCSFRESLSPYDAIVTNTFHNRVV